MNIRGLMKQAILGTTLAGALAIASITASVAEQQPLEVGLGLGFIDPGSKRNVGGDAAALLTFGTRFNSVWGGEVAAMFGNDISLVGARALYHLNELSGAWTPYVSFGAGITDEPGDHDTTGLVGVGVKHPINDTLGLRGEVNAHKGFDSGATDLSLFVALTWRWGGSMTKATAAPVAVAAVQDGDSDRDGVSDSRDDCSGTRGGTKVNAQGCPADRDGDGDGVMDSADQCLNSASGAKVDAGGCTLKLTEKVGITLNLNFDTDKADIKPDFADEIGKVASFMRQYSGTSVVIEGHTDNTGDGNYNQELSQRRAEAVADSLVRDHGVAGSRVKAVGYGDTRPVADNKTSAGRAQNRRVDAAIEETVTR